MASEYDALFYAGKPSRERHPDRMSVIAALAGVESPAVDTASVLELGCGTGQNIIALAACLPKAGFLGIDNSQAQIADGEKFISELGLANVKLHCVDLNDFPASCGSFDYIICHGVFSWVPRETQLQILSLIYKHLNPKGIAHVSYNCSPGWSWRGIIRQIAKKHDTIESGLDTRVRDSRALLSAIALALEDSGSPYALASCAEVQGILGQSDSYFYHELLATENHPLSVLDFIELAGSAGLKYLGDSRLSRMRAGRLRWLDVPVSYEGLIEKAGSRSDLIEQYFDYLWPTAVRDSLVCHMEAGALQGISFQGIKDFFVSSPLVPLNEHIAFDQSIEEFIDPRNMVIEVKSPVAKAALSMLAAKWPEAVSYRELCIASAQILGRRKLESDEKDELAEELLKFFGYSLVDCFKEPPLCSRAIGERPKTSALARLQAAKTNWAVNYRHEYLMLSGFERRLLELLDGTRDVPSLFSELVNPVLSGEVVLAEEGERVSDSERQKALVKEELERALKKLAEGAFISRE